jgi:hypothetical protein
VKERPILFSGPMVRAILDGRKTQTRRAVKINQRGCGGPPFKVDGVTVCSPHGVPGDRLWVRESLTYITSDPVNATPCKVHCYTASIPPGMTSANPYEANYLFPTDGKPHLNPKNTPGIFMPRWASRITLEVVDVRVQRLQDINQRDAMAEGTNGKHSYATLWDSLNAKRGFGWGTNPWVWVIEFKRVS